MLFYTEDYKGYRITGKPASREIDLAMGKPYKYNLTVSQGKDDISTLIITAQPEDIAVSKESDKNLVSTFGPNDLNDSVELGTRGYGFGIKAETWATLREAGLPHVRRMIDDGNIKKGSRQETPIKELSSPLLAK